MGLSIVFTVFALACAWEFWFESMAMHFFGLPYDDAAEAQDNWRYIGISLGFVSLSLIGPTIIMVRNNQRIESIITRLTIARNEANEANVAKSRFLANMSHELRTPLNAILGFSELTMREFFGPLDERYRSYAEDIHLSGKHLLTILNDVLDLSKSEVADLKVDLSDVSLCKMVNHLNRMVAPLIEQAHLNYEVTMSDTLPHIRADEVRLKQVLLNVISNAIKFTDAGGYISFEATQAEESVVITIADNGIGIAPENLLKVMEPFYQVDSGFGRKRGGTGLGLSISKRLVELMGGTVVLQSELAVGTRAIIRIPSVRSGKLKIAA